MAKKLGITKSEEWTLYRLRKGRADNQLKANPSECTRRDPSNFKIFLTPRDEEEIRHCELKEKEKQKKEEYKKKLAKMYEERDRECEERRQRYINKETDTY